MARSHGSLVRRGWPLALVLLTGCGSSREVRPPRLVRAVGLQGRAEQFAVGAAGALFYRVASYGPPSSPNEIKVTDAGGSPGQSIKLAGGAEVKALAADGRGTLYVGVREGGKDQIWLLPEGERGEEAEPQAKLKPELPGDLNHLFLGREPETLYALCGDRWVVKLKTDGSILKEIELPGDSRPEDGGVDGEGALYIRRSSGPVVKVAADGTVDQAWRQSGAAGHDWVRSVAVDSRGLVYISASERDIYLRAYKGSGELAFNVVAEPLESSPDSLYVAPDDWLYAQAGDKVLVFRP